MGEPHTCGENGTIYKCVCILCTYIIMWYIHISHIHSEVSRAHEAAAGRGTKDGRGVGRIFNVGDLRALFVCMQHFHMYTSYMSGSDR